MKVLFAVGNEEISEAIVKKYQKDYKQIISYKNVYYFNAILKELQKDKTYDRIVISEDLEAFTSTQYNQIDKFIFDKLDSITDEASTLNGTDIPIIIICSDRRTKSEEMLVKIFGIGIYNALIGTDRSVEEICGLINRPRSKKDGKTYYQIDARDTNYVNENENDVSEVEIQNILAHYKRLGQNTDRYLESFNNIAEQYNDTQLRIICKFLPLNVRAVLEEKSEKYQSVMAFNKAVSSGLRISKKEIDGPSEKFLKNDRKNNILSKPIVIPSSIDMNSSKKLARTKKKYVEKKVLEDEILNDVEEVEEVEKVEEKEEVKPKPVLEQEQPVKRKRGRPRKNPVPEVTEVPKKRRGRPRKNPLPEEIEVKEEKILPGIDFDEEDNDDILPGLESYKEDSKNEVLPGLNFENEKEFKPEVAEEDEKEDILPGLDFGDDEDDDENEKNEDVLPGLDFDDEEDDDEYDEDEEYDDEEDNEEEPEEEQEPIKEYTDNNSNMKQDRVKPIIQSNYYDESIDDTDEEYIEKIDLTNLLSYDKKIVTFVGTSKNGTSFIVNNLAEYLSKNGVKVAILDTTKNRNSYYVYTNNEKELMRIATDSIDNLAKGFSEGVKINNNLTVYTSLPGEESAVNHTDRILETLLENHSLILVDADFDTPIRYFEQSQEIYLVQTLDVVTIQPLTAFLRKLRERNVYEEQNLRIILNKAVKLRGVNDKLIIGGMANYKDPSMSNMVELFDRDSIKYISIPFEEETYTRYLESLIQCQISLKGYSKSFMQSFAKLANMVYSKKEQSYVPPSANKFSNNMNDTLEQMKKRY